jgi:7-cyano-7-deazaguanine synthase in queuosine biosynthesis
MRAVRYVGQKSCKDLPYQNALASNDSVVLSTMPRGGNVTLRFEIDGKPLEVGFDRTRRDFLDLATCVYILDEILLRERAADGWSRSFDLLFPVHDPARWEAGSGTLASMLWTLAGDEYRCSFPLTTALQPLGSHRRHLPSGYDAVCLFSGGMDSLLGAHKLLAEGKRVLLVGHQADGTAARAQSDLAGELNLIFPPVNRLPRLRLIQCRAARSMAESQRFSLPEKCEETHRPRSLLFLALAVSISGATRIKEIYIPENGLIALNPALQKSRLGTLSTRTAHPLFLAKFCDVAAILGVFDGAIKNPFLYWSKTDMLAASGLDPRLKPLLVRSVSCARPSKFKDKGVRHCGYCVPCLYRRISMMELGLDSNQDYAFDVFNGLPRMSALTQLDFRALVSFAKIVGKSSAIQRDGMLLSHGSFSPSLGGRFGPYATGDYSVWSEMLLRWATDFLHKVRQLSSGPTKRILAI